MGAVVAHLVSDEEIDMWEPGESMNLGGYYSGPAGRKR